MNIVYLVLITPKNTDGISTIDSIYDSRTKAEIKEQELYSSQKFENNVINIVEMSVL